MNRANRQVERSERTRSALLAAARTLFSDRGYASVAVEDVVRRAGVTRGALYHQFPDGKRDLFRRVVEAVEQELMDEIAAVMAADADADPLVGLRRGVEAALDASLDPGLARLTLIDAPAVLGWEAWRALGERYALGTVRTALGAAMEAGTVEPGPVDPLAQLLLAAVEEAVLHVGRADDRQAARVAAGAALARLIDGLGTSPTA